MRRPQPRQSTAWLAELHQRLLRAQVANHESHRLALRGLRSQLMLLSPLSTLRSDQQRLDELLHRSQQSIKDHLRLTRVILQGIENNLENLNPQTVLRRGYAIISFTDGVLVRSASQVNPGDQLNVRVRDGDFPVEALPPISQET